MKIALPLLLRNAIVYSMLLFPIATKAQYVTIPDTNFVKFLNSTGFTPCMTGNQLDTTCPLVTGSYTLICDTQQIADFTGIQYFHNLQYFECTYNHLDSLPPLPSSLNTLVCNNNRISFLPALPNGLTSLNCTFNKLDSLPQLPDSLLFLTCDYNKLTSLPALPVDLNYLSCDSNGLTTLPALPNSLTELSCNINQLTALPVLDSNLTNLVCYNNQLSSLPVLPAGLVSLSCGANEIAALPALPNGLQYLQCFNNQLSVLPALPANLYSLDCSSNYLLLLPALPQTLSQLTCSDNYLNALPQLPEYLYSLSCNNNQLDTLPPLPFGLQSLNCAYDALTVLPALPLGLESLSCPDNSLDTLPTLPPLLSLLFCDNDLLTSLPGLPASIYQLTCSNNQLTSLPSLPDSLLELDCSFNPGLHCLPPLQAFTGPDYFFFINGTGITCLPNAILTDYPIPAINAMPICDIFNANGCPIHWNIEGEAFQDTSGDCTLEAGEQQITPMKINLYQGGSLVQSGYFPSYYSFKTGLAAYTVQLDTANLPFVTTCATDSTVTVSSADSLYHINFGMDCKPGFDVGVGYIVGRFRAARYTTLHIGAGDISNLFGGHCAAGVNGTVTVSITGPANYISPAAGALLPTTVNGNTISWVITNFNNASSNQSFNLIVEADTTAQIADQVCVTVSVTPVTGDNDTTNNTVTQCFGVSSSYDPNEKQVSPAGNFYDPNEWLTYTIYFQNTGNDTAQNIYITDTLNRNLDPTTFQYLSSSAKTIAQISGYMVVFQMPNINLPDTSGNNPLAEGYVQYRVKMKSDLPHDTHITNTAWVYFDFNPPVPTNTATSTYSITAGIPDVGTNKINLSVFPNPSTSLLNIIASGFVPQWISIYDLQGQKVSEQRYTQQINISALTAGVYFIEVKNEAVSTRQKVVKFSGQ